MSPFHFHSLVTTCTLWHHFTGAAATADGMRVIAGGVNDSFLLAYSVGGPVLKPVLLAERPHHQQSGSQPLTWSHPPQLCMSYMCVVASGSTHCVDVMMCQQTYDCLTASLG